MSDRLYFMMGTFRAEIPTDRHYSARHLWLQSLENGLYRVGFTSYSVRLLQDVYFLEWTVDEGSPVQERQEIGEIESSKAVSALYAPADGTISGFNEAVLSDPSAINVDPYGSGWLLDMHTAGPLLTPEEYIRVLEDGWEDTQKTIKGQLH